MTQFESFKNVKGEVVVVNKMNITYIKTIDNSISRIYFNAPGINNTVQHIDVECSIEQIERILNEE